MTTTTGEPVLCRRCRRPLTHPLSVAARVGLGCARHLSDSDVATLAGRLVGVQLALDIDVPSLVEQGHLEAA
ncbi:hypothetical protein FRAHR75_620013 [Frankia sp. Hr75.2]|nr:hypothetical protein FRAHR75_620013 [Frankia sp. Hr75.2]